MQRLSHISFAKNPWIHLAGKEGYSNDKNHWPRVVMVIRSFFPYFVLTV